MDTTVKFPWIVAPPASTVFFAPPPTLQAATRPQQMTIIGRGVFIRNLQAALVCACPQAIWFDSGAGANSANIIRSNCCRLERRFAGRVSHPLRDGAFPRHTVCSAESLRVLDLRMRAYCCRGVQFTPPHTRRRRGGSASRQVGEHPHQRHPMSVRGLHRCSHVGRMDEIPHLLFVRKVMGRGLPGSRDRPVQVPETS